MVRGLLTRKTPGWQPYIGATLCNEPAKTHQTGSKAALNNRHTTFRVGKQDLRLYFNVVKYDQAIAN